ncbi:Cas9 inhibitor AcrIIA9 family protein [Latilactobacillus sakei]|uniref:Cas9 inhibitor AcrIIA9 family protein n=1 Tax=Latilactobacillus sakei TaxID=1599 RepID=UPI0024E0038C|nr:Cas9 inhibitor AcrIIA9 family protein [Latilactobacillus sakei]
MTPLKQQALKKMLIEMNESHSLVVDQIHNWLCNQDDDDLLNGILTEDKTITKSMAYCNAKAKEFAKDGVAMIEDATVYDWVREYFTTPDLELDKPEPNYTHEKVEVPGKMRNPEPETIGDAEEPKAIAKKVGEQLDIFDYLGK